MMLQKACEHGRFFQHSIPIPCPDNAHDAYNFEGQRVAMSCTVLHYVTCPGGSEPTTEELVEELNRRRDSAAPYDIEIPDFVNRNSMGW